MSNPIIEDYLRALARQLRNLPLRERQAVLDEVRQHLQTETRRLRQQDRTRSADEAALKATNAFGPVEEIGVAYGPQGGVVRRGTGEVLLDVAILTSRGVGRGVKSVLKWGGIIAAVLLFASLVVIVTGAVFADKMVDRFQDDIREAIPRTVYDYDRSWSAPDVNNELRSDTFQVGPEIKEFRLHAQTQPDTGCAQIQLVAPSGTVIDLNGNGCQATSQRSTYTEEGTWTVRYVYAAYTGSVSVEVVAFERARR